jgi:hypothetical protein
MVSMDTRLRLRTMTVILGMFLAASCSKSPTAPSAAPALRSIRYVRTRPVVNPLASRVLIYMEYPNIGCWGCQGSSASQHLYVSLTPIDATTFEYPYASNVDDIPVDTSIFVMINDPFVSSDDVASDVYINGAKVSSYMAGQQEHGSFRVRSDGTVY